MLVWFQSPGFTHYVASVEILKKILETYQALDVIGLLLSPIFLNT